MRKPAKAIEIQNRVALAKEFFWYVRTNFETQAEAADYFNTNRASLSNIINGRQDLKPRMVEALGYELMYVRKVETNE